MGRGLSRSWAQQHLGVLGASVLGRKSLGGLVCLPLCAWEADGDPGPQVTRTLRFLCS